MKKNQTVVLKNYEALVEEINARKGTKYLEFGESLRFVLQNEELHLDFGGKVIPVRETALPSILARMGIAGRTFYEMTDAELQKVFEVTQFYLPTAPNMVNIMVADGCINSVNSDIYAHIPTEEILDEVMGVVEPMFKGDLKLEASVGYDITHIKFFTDRSFTFNGKQKKLMITFTNSENGTSCIRFAAYIRSGGNLIPIMTDIAVVHKGDDKKGFNRVIESISMLDGVINEAVNALRKLQKIEVNHIESTITICASRIGLPKKYIEKVRKDFVNISSCYASDIYEAFSNAIANQDNLSTYERYKNDVVKLINLDWEEITQK